MHLYGQLGAPAGLQAVVPGFRSLQGLGDAATNNSMRWGFFTVAAALVGVFVVYQELKK